MAEPSPRVLSERELNRALLARQLLLERAKLPLPQALERVAGIPVWDATLLAHARRHS